MPRLTRVLGLATVGYSVAIVVRPEVLAAPCGLTEPDGTVSPGLTTLIASLGARDTLIGAAMALLPAGRPLRTAVLVRAACDLSDAVVFGLTLPDPANRRKAAGVAVAWAALCAAAGLSGR